MYEKFVRERITQLRLQKGVSEYKMSYELGHCKGYVNNISSGKALPSMAEFFAICDYFEMTPLDFFDTTVKSTKDADALAEKLRTLSPDDLRIITALVERFTEAKK